eukprot:913271-Pyramimonas_sp.AAC.1
MGIAQNGAHRLASFLTPPRLPWCALLRCTRYSPGLLRASTRLSTLTGERRLTRAARLRAKGGSSGGELVAIRKHLASTSFQSIRPAAVRL